MQTEPIIPPGAQKAPGAGAQEPAKVEINIPAPTGASLDEKVRFEAELFAYGALCEACARLRWRIDKILTVAKPLNLVLLDESFSALFEAEATFQDQTDNLRQAFASTTEVVDAVVAELESGKEALVESASTAQALSPGAGLTAALSLFKALQTETAYFGRSVAVAPRTLELELARQWEREPDVALYLSSLVPGFSPKEGADVQERLNAVTAARTAAFKAIHKLSTVIREIGPKDKKYASTLSALNGAKEQFEAADAVQGDFLPKLSVVDPVTKLTLLQLVQRAARLRSLLATGGRSTFFLFVAVVTAGGSYRLVKNLWRSLFWADGVEVAAGALLSYGLFDGTGKLVSSGLVSSGQGFVTLKKLWSGFAGGCPPKSRP